MVRRITFAVLCVLLLASSAGAETGQEKVARLQQKVENANKREGVLTSSIAATNARVHSLQGSVASAESKLVRLQVEVVQHEQRLAQVKNVYEQQSHLLELARR